MVASVWQNNYFVRTVIIYSIKSRILSTFCKLLKCKPNYFYLMNREQIKIYAVKPISTIIYIIFYELNFESANT